MPFDDTQTAVSTTGVATLGRRREFVLDALGPVRQPSVIGPQVVVLWRVHESCSLSCQFCGYSRDVNRPRATAIPRQVLDFGRVLGDAQRCHSRSILVSWLGGEPLAWRGLPELSHVLCHDYGLSLGVTTNGIPLASHRLRRSLLADYRQVTISIDGLAPFHDRVRGRAGLFERLRRDVQRLRDEDAGNRLWRRVNTVVMRGNVETFGEFCEAMADWGFHELTFNALGGSQRPEFFARNRLLPQQVRRFVAEFAALQERMARRGLRICGGQRYLDRIEALTSGEPVSVDDCQPASEFLFVDPQGRISPCSFSTQEYGVPLDEVRSAAELLELPQRFQQLRNQCRLAACRDCHATHLFDKFKGELTVQGQPTTETPC
jgi:radical SAM protein with 4Fe4S-binding SPASM domain